MTDGPGGAPELSIIVVNYNTRAMTLEALDSAIAQTRETSYELIVVDNASHDGSAEAIAERFPEIRLMAETENHGFARANNIAARQARGAYLLLLNPDTVTLDGAIDRLMAFARAHPEAGIWGGRTLFADHSLNPTSCWADQTLWSLFCRASGLSLIFPRSPLFNPESYGGWARDTVREVDIVQGSFFLIRRSLWERLGGFDLTYVMYGEEADLCLRARAGGARPIVSPEPTIIHYLGASSNMRADKQILVLKAKATLIRRHMARWKQPLALFLLRMWPWGRTRSAGLVAGLTGRARFREVGESWGRVWAARTVWQAGYPDQRGAGPET